MLAMPTMLCSPAAAVVATENGPAAVPTGKVEAAAKKKVDVFGDSKGEDGGGSTAAAGGDGSSTKAIDGGASELRCHSCGKKGHWRVDCTEDLCSRCHGRGHATDVCPTSKKEAVLAASTDDDDDTVEASAFKAGQAGNYSDVLGRKGEGESA